MRFARRHGFFQRRSIHPRHHQHAPGSPLLHDGRNQAIRIKLQFLVKAHVSFSQSNVKSGDLNEKNEGASCKSEARNPKSDYTAFNAAIIGKRAARMAGKRLPITPTMIANAIPSANSTGVMRNSKTTSLNVLKLSVPK